MVHFPICRVPTSPAARPRAGVRRVLYAAAPLGVLAFWCGLWIANERYPTEYDWRYMTYRACFIRSVIPADIAGRGRRRSCGLGGLCWVLALYWSRRLASARDLAGRHLGDGTRLHLHGVLRVVARAISSFREKSRHARVGGLHRLCIGTVHLTYLRLDRNYSDGRAGSPAPVDLRVRCRGAALLPILLVASPKPMSPMRYRNCRGSVSNGASGACPHT